MSSNTIEHFNWTFNNYSKICHFDISCVDIKDDKSVINIFDNDDDKIKSKYDDLLKQYRRSALVHKIVRKDIKKLLHDGVKYWDVVNSIETNIIKLTCGSDITKNEYFSNLDKYKSGIAFPIGFSVNEIAAHDTSHFLDERELSAGDVVKVDIGVTLNDHIIDSAFSHIIPKTRDSDYIEDSPYISLLNASYDATMSAISISGVDMRLSELSEQIQEIIESYEIDLGSKTIDINAVGGLGGHNVLPNKVHGHKLILCKPHECQEGLKMEEGEIFAIETYASSGYGELTQKSDMTHFEFDPTKVDKKMKKFMDRKSKSGLEEFLFKREKLPFSSHWLYNAGIKEPLFYLKKYVSNKVVVAYPPLTDKSGSKISQYEHTICIKENGVEILSLGNDY